MHSEAAPYIISFPFITIDRQTFQIIQIHFIQFFLHIVQIMFEKLYETHLGAVQFLEHDLHIFALFLNIIKVLKDSSLSSFLIVLAKGSTSPIIKRQVHID